MALFETLALNSAFGSIPGLYALFLKGQGHQGIFSLAKGTLWGNCEFLLEHFKVTKAMARGNGGNHVHCIREISGLPSSCLGRPECTRNCQNSPSRIWSWSRGSESTGPIHCTWDVYTLLHLTLYIICNVKHWTLVWLHDLHLQSCGFKSYQVNLWFHTDLCCPDILTNWNSKQWYSMYS